MRGGPRDLGPEIADEDLAAGDLLLVIEGAAPVIGEAADGGWQAEGAVARIGPVKAPLGRCRVVETSVSPSMSARRLGSDAELVHVGAAVPDGPTERRPFVLDPLGRAAQRIRQPAQVDLPAAEGEVEVVLSVAKLHTQDGTQRTPET